MFKRLYKKEKVDKWKNIGYDTSQFENLIDTFVR